MDGSRFDQWARKLAIRTDRRCVLQAVSVLIAGTLLSRSATVRAEDEQGIAWVSGRGGIRGYLKIATDGSLRIRSTVRQRDATGATTLVAEPVSAEVTFADANGNGTAGLTQIQFVARNPATSERVAVALATVGAEDIDRNGSYIIVLRIGEAETTVPVDVRLLPTRTRPRRRKR
jgi:hypothetical protein